MGHVLSSYTRNVEYDPWSFLVRTKSQHIGSSGINNIGYHNMLPYVSQ